jgi:hypothetical protein
MRCNHLHRLDIAWQKARSIGEAHNRLIAVAKSIPSSKQEGGWA